MHLKPSRLKERVSKISGLTLVELLAVIVIVVILAALLLPSRHSGVNARYITCINNLKQIAFAELIWAGEHGDKFPAQASTNTAGTQEYLTNGQVGLHYQALKPYLPSLVSVVRCPTDKRVAATNFEALTNENISYFASLDTGVSNTYWLLAGDRHLVPKGNETKPGGLNVMTNSVLSWTKEMHYGSSGKLFGVVVFGDCHAEGAGENRLRSMVSELGSRTNRLVFP
jgi:type II secretory pathway pseudopilin PulG